MTSDKANHRFLLSELIRRDFIKKYKRTTFGILWSALSPLFLLLTMDVVFGTFFGRNMPHYTIYLFCGLLLFNYFSAATRSAMRVLYDNAQIYSKVPVPKHYFLVSQSVAQAIDFFVSLLVFFIFVAIDGISFHWRFLYLLYPMICLYFINFGIGMFLSTLYITPALFFVSLLSYIYRKYKDISLLQSVLACLRPVIVALIFGAGLSILSMVVFFMAASRGCMDGK